MLDEDFDKILLHGERGVLAEKKSYKGDGIGMSVIEKMVGLNGGDFDYKRISEYSDGVDFCEQVFMITLPCKK